MNRLLKLLICGALSAMLTLTGQSMAVARGASAATGQMVICSGMGPVVVYTDAQGRPTAAPHVCPDCMLVLSFDVVQQVTVPAGRILPQRLGVALGHRVDFMATSVGFLSRAPPVRA